MSDMRRLIHVYTIFLAVVALSLALALNTSALSTLNFTDYIQNVFVEAHGLLFDVILFGVIFYLQQAVYERNKEKSELSKEIDNLRGWNETEAKYGLKRIVKKASEQKYVGLNYNQCHMPGMRLRYPYFEKCYLGTANLEKSIMPFGFF